MLSVAGPIADIVLLRGLFAERDEALHVGSVLSARVIDPHTLLLAGVRIPARIPPELAAGEAIRVQVQEISSERFVLQVVPQPAPPAPSVPAAAYAFALPGGAQARVHVDPEEASAAERGGGGRRSITLRFDSPALGRLDFAIDLDAGAVSSTVSVVAGDPAAAARAAAGELEAALSAATSRPASVSIRERGETLDVRA